MKRMLTVLALVLAAGGCDKQAATEKAADPQAVAPAEGATQGATQGAAVATAEGAATVEGAATKAGEAPAECGKPVEEGCSGDHGTEPVASPDERIEKDPASGASVTAVGAVLAGSEVVTVKDLLANPDAYAGKSVRLEGNVSAMCTHRRGWFAVIDDGDRTGTVVRVLTAPAFLVPEGSIGRKARAEGTVEVVDVAAGAARHYAAEHKVGDPAELAGDAPIKQIVIRATGAEFL